MRIRHVLWRDRLPEDDPQLAGLVADLKALHSAPAPIHLQQGLVACQRQKVALTGTAVPGVPTAVGRAAMRPQSQARRTP